MHSSKHGTLTAVVLILLLSAVVSLNCGGKPDAGKAEQEAGEETTQIPEPGEEGSDEQDESDAPSEEKVDLAADILKAVVTQLHQFQDISGKARITTMISGEIESATVGFAYLAPYYFRLNIKGPFGINYGIITADSESLMIYIPNENAYVMAPRDSKSAQAVIPAVEFDVNRILNVMSGNIPGTKTIGGEIIGMDRSGEWHIMTMYHEEKVYRYTVREPDYRIARIEMIEDGSSQWVIRFGSYMPCGDGVFPGEIDIVDGGSELNMDILECEGNTGLSARDVVFTPPDSATRFSRIVGQED